MFSVIKKHHRWMGDPTHWFGQLRAILFGLLIVIAACIWLFVASFLLLVVAIGVVVSLFR